MTGASAPLDDKEIARAQAQADAIADAAKTPKDKKEFVFFAAFDGTDNAYTPVNGDPQNTSIAQLADQVQKNEQGASFKSKYYAGVGTPGTKSGSDAFPDAVMAQSIKTANEAYSDFAKQADLWRDDHKGGSLTAMVTGFSRGAASAAIFSQKLYEEGLVTKDGRQLIPPGKEGAVSAALMLDPVLTGTSGNMDFPPTTRNLVVVRAQNEARSLFEAAEFNDPKAKVLPAMGNHCDIGGAYDQGLGGIYLEAYTGFFRKSGLDIAPVSPERRYDPNKPVVIHSESAASLKQAFEAPWDVPTDDISAGRKTVSHGQPAEVKGGASIFTAYNGELLLGGKGGEVSASRSHIDLLPGSQWKVEGAGDTIIESENARLAFASAAAVMNKGHPVQTRSHEDVYQQRSLTIIDMRPGAVLDISGGNVSVVGRNARVVLEPGASAEIAPGNNVALDADAGTRNFTLNGRQVTLDASTHSVVSGIANLGVVDVSPEQSASASACVSGAGASLKCR